MSKILYLINLQLFAVQVTTQDSLSDEMKTFYDMALIDEAQANLVHDQFGQERDIPANGGKTIQFRKFAALNKALVPLTEGETPPGNSLTVTAIEATVAQYGDYILQSDVLELTALDNTILEATKLLGRQAGLTLDTVTRNVLQAEAQLAFASKWSGSTETEVNSMSDLDLTSVMKVDTVNQTVASLKAANAPTFNGYYVGIIHPYNSYELKREAHKYAEPEELFTGEIGRIGGVRFVETTEAKIYRAHGLTAGSRTLTVKTTISSSTTTVAVKEAITADDVTAFAARPSTDKFVYIDGEKVGVSALVAGSAGSATITLAEATASLAANKVIYDFGGTSEDLAVFSTLFLAKGAYGKTNVTGGGLQTIIKQKGSAGTADPLDQRSSVGWKAIKTAKVLIPDYIRNVMSCSPRYSGKVNEN